MDLQELEQKRAVSESTLVIKIGHTTMNFDLFPENKLKDLIEAVDKIYSEKHKKGG